MSEVDDTLGSGAGPGTGEPSRPNIDQEAMAEAVIREIQRPEQPVFNATEVGESAGLGGQFIDDSSSETSPGFLPALDLPGFGEPYGDDAPGGACGDPRTHVCEDCGYDIEIGRTCARSVCPRCAAAWVMKRAGTSRENGEAIPGIVARLVKTAKMMSGSSGKSIKFQHWTASPPDDWMVKAEDPLEKTQQTLKRICKRVFDANGISAYHPYRGDREEPDAGSGLRDDRGQWKDRVMSGREWEDVRDELDVSPHFHMVLCAEYIPVGITEKIEEETGWVFKRITKRGSNVSIGSDLESLARVVTYVMSHTGIRTDYGADGSNHAAYTEWGTQDGRVYDDDRVAADLAVRTVAPRTLGIPGKKVECKRQVPEELRALDRVDAYRNTTASDSSSSETSSSPTDDLEQASGDSGTLVPCDGRIWDISNLPGLLAAEDFQARIRDDQLHELWLIYLDEVNPDDAPDTPPPPD